MFYKFGNSSEPDCSAFNRLHSYLLVEIILIRIVSGSRESCHKKKGERSRDHKQQYWPSLNNTGTNRANCSLYLGCTVLRPFNKLNRLLNWHCEFTAAEISARRLLHHDKAVISCSIRRKNGTLLVVERSYQVRIKVI